MAGVTDGTALPFSDAARASSVSTRSGHVLAALAERRERDRDDAEAVEEILAEASLGDEPRQVGVRGRDDAHVGVLRLDRAHGQELALLQDAQELRLGLDRHRADLVEEDRALVGGLEQALLVGDRAGERAAHVAEEVRLEEVGRERAGVNGDERARGARREPVERLRDELLAGAALAGDEDRRARGAPPGGSSRRRAPSTGSGR